MIKKNITASVDPAAGHALHALPTRERELRCTCSEAAGAVEGGCSLSRRRPHTRLSCDWSSDVCSSDLGGGRIIRAAAAQEAQRKDQNGGDSPEAHGAQRSEERRVGKEGKSRWSPY